MSNGKFTVNLVVDFDINEATAIHILSDPKPGDVLRDYLIRAHNVSLQTYIGESNVGYLKKALGDFLANQKIGEAKQLPLSTRGEA